MGIVKESVAVAVLNLIDDSCLVSYFLSVKNFERQYVVLCLAGQLGMRLKC